VQRLSSELVRVALSLTTIQFSLDPVSDPVDRSDRAPSASAQVSPRSMVHRIKTRSAGVPLPLIGRHNRAVNLLRPSPTLDDALQKFRSQAIPIPDALFIIKT